MARRGGFLGYVYEEGSEELHKAYNWLYITIFISIFIFCLFALLSLPLGYMIGNSFSDASYDAAIKFVKISVTNPAHLFTQYWTWLKQVVTYDGAFSLAMWVPILPIIMFFTSFFIGFFTNPYEFVIRSMGDARIAEPKDMQKMGVFDGKYMLLGAYNGKMVKLTDVGSVLCVGGTGVGKTAAVCVPAILEADDHTIFAYDPKGELWGKTCGHRATLGPVYNFAWHELDRPDEGVYFARWNPLGPGNFPPPCPGRENYTAGLAYFLVPDGGDGGDDYWTKIARGTLTGLLLYLAFKVEQAKANDYFLGKLNEGGLDEADVGVLESYYRAMQGPGVKKALINLKKGALDIDNYLPIGCWEGLPEAWEGRQACFAMVLDWLTQIQIKVNMEDKAIKDTQDRSLAHLDPMRVILERCIDEAVFFGYSRRTILELNQFANTPKKQRSSIMSLIIAGMTPFKNPTIRERTCSSDIYFGDMRGYKDPDGNWHANSVYLSCVALPGSQGMFKIFFEYMGGTCISSKPGVGGMGPFPCLMVVDDMQGIPSVGTILDGPAWGRNARTSLLLVFQDFSQVNKLYGPDALENLIGNVSAKIVLRTNNEFTASRFVDMIDTGTAIVKSKHQQYHMGRAVNPYEWGVGAGAMAVKPFSKSNVLNLPLTKQFVLLQRNMTRPMKLDSPRYYLFKHLAEMAEIPPIGAVPDFAMAKRDEVDKTAPDLVFSIPDIEFETITIEDDMPDDDELDTFSDIGNEEEKLSTSERRRIRHDEEADDGGIDISLLGGEEIYVPGLYNEPPAQLVSPLADNNSYYNEPVPVVWNNMPDVAPEPSPPNDWWMQDESFAPLNPEDFIKGQTDIAYEAPASSAEDTISDEDYAEFMEANNEFDQSTLEETTDDWNRFMGDDIEPDDVVGNDASDNDFLSDDDWVNADLEDDDFSNKELDFEDDFTNHDYGASDDNFDGVDDEDFLDDEDWSDAFEEDDDDEEK